MSDSQLTTLQVPIAGMDCADCTLHVQRAIAALDGVLSVDVFLAAERANIQIDPAVVTLESIRHAVRKAGYSVPAETPKKPVSTPGTDFSRRVGRLLGLLFGVILFVVVAGEWFGLFERITQRIPWPVGVALVLIGGFPVYRKVVRATLNRQIISHTLMTLGVIAALAVGQWPTAAVVVFFMRIGDYVERFTADRARRAVKDLTAFAPKMARLAHPGGEVMVPVDSVQPDDIVIVRPGEQIPVDGLVIGGHAMVNQASLTGEAMPVTAGPGTNVHAATLAQGGHLRVRVTQAGADTTFGRVIRLVEEAEANRANVQRAADRFSAYFLPFVAGIAALTFFLRRDPLAVAAVLVVACSCSFALATPIAMLATIGAGARRGLLIKGGRYLEALARADVLLIDKTGTLTFGQPQLTRVLPTADLSESELIWLAASAERYSEHPLAEALRGAAREQGLTLAEPSDFQATPGVGVRSKVAGRTVLVGGRRSLGSTQPPPAASALEAEGCTLSFVTVDGWLAGILGAMDTLRAEVPAALDDLRRLGLTHVELLTGDNTRVAGALARDLNLPYRANLLPEDKMRIVREYQAKGHTVAMIGDGVNDAPALAQADVGIAMAATGTDIAIEAADIALLRDDWTLIPELFRLARRTMRVVKANLGVTAAYNLVGLTLAALGILPPILAAAAQSLPDLGILGNSSRLLRSERFPKT